MEIEKEKRKIEFWTESMTINEAIARYSPKKPFTKMVKVSVRCTYQAQRITSKPSTQGMKVYAIASCISSLLIEYGYIKAGTADHQDGYREAGVSVRDSCFSCRRWSDGSILPGRICNPVLRGLQGNCSDIGGSLICC